MRKIKLSIVRNEIFNREWFFPFRAPLWLQKNRAQDCNFQATINISNRERTLQVRMKISCVGEWFGISLTIYRIEKPEIQKIGENPIFCQFSRIFPIFGQFFPYFQNFWIFLCSWSTRCQGVVFSCVRARMNFFDLWALREKGPEHRKNEVKKMPSVIRRIRLLYLRLGPPCTGVPSPSGPEISKKSQKGLSGPPGPECPKKVQKESKRCQNQCSGTSSTLFNTPGLRRADTQTPTRHSVFSTHSDTQAVPAFHCFRMFEGIFSTRARF